MKLKFAELHTPLFFMGVNFGTKLEISKRQIKLFFNVLDNKLYLLFNGQVCVIPEANIASMTLADSSPLMKWFDTDQDNKEQAIVPQKPSPIRGRPKAQVSTPTSHVFDEPKV